MLKTIYLYFNVKTRQKTQNGNFKLLFQRIKEELQEREIFKKYKKFKLPIFQLNNSITQIEEVNIPDFFNDKKNDFNEKKLKNTFSTNSSSPSISEKSYEEDNLREQLEQLKQEKAALYEMLNNKIYASSNEIKEEEKCYFNFYSKFNSNKISDFNFDVDRNLFEEQKINFQKI